MTKQNLEIIDFEDKKTQAGKRYTRFKTSDGWMSCFDTTTCDELKKFEGKLRKLKLRKVGNLVTLKNDLGVGDKANEDSQEVEVVKPQAKKPAFNQNAMYVSYAKDFNRRW